MIGVPATGCPAGQFLCSNVLSDIELNVKLVEYSLVSSNSMSYPALSITGIISSNKLT